MYTTILDLMLCMLVAFSVIIYAINTVKILALYLRYSAHERSGVASGKRKDSNINTIPNGIETKNTRARIHTTRTTITRTYK